MIIDIDEKIIEKYIAEECGFGNLLLNEEAEIYRKWLEHDGDIELRRTEAELDIDNMYKKHIGNFLLALKKLFIINGEHIPAWLSAQKWDEYALMLKEAVRSLKNGDRG